jgi:hypothetical protein
MFVFCQQTAAVNEVTQRAIFGNQTCSSCFSLGESTEVSSGKRA